jgi:hypothetical protein
MIVRLAKDNDGVFIDERMLYQRRHSAFRGPRVDRTYADHSIDKWIKYDALFFQTLDREWQPYDFRPFPGRDQDNGPALSLLQKGVILFQRKVYAGAKRALGDYRQALGERAPSRPELAVAAGLMGCHHGIGDLLAPGSDGAAFAIWMRARRWPLSIRVAFAAEMRWRIRAASSSGDIRFAGRLLRYSRDTFGLAAILAVMSTRYGANRREWRAQG